jgi:hypothetical protein
VAIPSKTMKESNHPSQRPPVSVVFGFVVVLSVLGSAFYVFCFYLK